MTLLWEVSVRYLRPRRHHPRLHLHPRRLTHHLHPRRLAHHLRRRPHHRLIATTTCFVPGEPGTNVPVPVPVSGVRCSV